MKMGSYIAMNVRSKIASFDCIRPSFPDAAAMVQWIRDALYRLIAPGT
jgi:hypothetical protein